MWRFREQGSGKPVPICRGEKTKLCLVLCIFHQEEPKLFRCPYAIANLTLAAT